MNLSKELYKSYSKGMGGILKIREADYPPSVWDETEAGIMYFIPVELEDEDDLRGDDVNGFEIMELNSYWINHKEELYQDIHYKTGASIEDLKKVIEPYFRK